MLMLFTSANRKISPEFTLCLAMKKYDCSIISKIYAVMFLLLVCFEGKLVFYRVVKHNSVNNELIARGHC